MDAISSPAVLGGKSVNYASSMEVSLGDNCAECDSVVVSDHVLGENQGQSKNGVDNEDIVVPVRSSMATEGCEVSGSEHDGDKNEVKESCAVCERSPHLCFQHYYKPQLVARYSSSSVSDVHSNGLTNLRSQNWSLVDCCEPMNIRDRSPNHLGESPLANPNGTSRWMPVGAGLANLGNTCFMNSILQCFTHTVPLIKALRAVCHDKHCENSGFCVLCALREHIELSLISTGKVLSPLGFFHNLNHFSSSFRVYQQEDAHEFLQCFLDKLDTCCEKSRSAEKNGKTEGDNLVGKIFGGRLVSKLWCSNCGKCSEQFEPIIDMSLEIENINMLESALESFTKLEKIDDAESQMFCENCQERVSMEKQLMLDRPPRVAVFHLKRFKTEGYFIEKISKRVSFPLELDLKPYASTSQEHQADMKYKLFAFVVHNGHLPTSGHYLSYVRSGPTTWYRLDDEAVTELEEDEVMSEEAYILFYAEEGTPWFSSVMQPPSPPTMCKTSNTSPTSVLDVVDDGGHDLSPPRVVIGGSEDYMMHEQKGDLHDDNDDVRTPRTGGFSGGKRKLGSDRKSEEAASKMTASPEMDPQKKEAVRYMKKSLMSNYRKSLLMAAMTPKNCGKRRPRESAGPDHNLGLSR